jgi:hypothetical protein
MALEERDMIAIADLNNVTFFPLIRMQGFGVGLGGSHKAWIWRQGFDLRRLPLTTDQLTDASGLIGSTSSLAFAADRCP